MNPKELIKYELPSITEYISWNWLQDIIARYYSKKVNRKYLRYQYRIKRDEFYKNLIKEQ